MDDAWRRVNHTELYQACTEAGLNVHPRCTTEELAAYITGELEPSATNPINDWRDAIMRFVRDYWKKVHVQLKCPAGTGDPRACYGCVDAKVIDCIVQSKRVEHLIEARRPRR